MHRGLAGEIEKSPDGGRRTRARPAPPPLGRAGYAAVAAAIAVAAAAILLALGRTPVCPCGVVRLWYGAAGGPGNSQHLVDWFSFLHVTHGILTWPVFWLTSRHWPHGWLVLMGLLTAAGWEVVENTSFVIEAFGPSPSGADYDGDSIVNSLSDMAFATLGFRLAMSLGWRGSVALAVAIEVVVTAAIRDGIVLGAVGMFGPVPEITEWQREAAAITLCGAGETNGGRAGCRWNLTFEENSG